MGQLILMYRTKIEIEKTNYIGRTYTRDVTKYSDRASEAQEWIDLGLRVQVRPFWYYGRARYVPKRYSKWEAWKGS